MALSKITYQARTGNTTGKVSRNQIMKGLGCHTKEFLLNFVKDELLVFLFGGNRSV